LKVSLVLISHSGSVVEGLREMVAQVAGEEVRVEIAGGTEDGRLGTSTTKIASALQVALVPAPDGEPDVLILLDLGSAALSLEIALEELTEHDRARVRISEAPLVEGAILAAVQASVGASIDEVAAAAASASTMAKMPRS
jgi:PTS hybrid protein